MNLEEMILHIDKVADHIRNIFVGDPVRAFEYQKTEQEALVFKSLNYQGDVPQTVKSHQEATGWTAQEACDDILKEAMQFNYALNYIRDVRLKGKALLKSSPVAAQEVTFQQVISQLKLIIS